MENTTNNAEIFIIDSLTSGNKCTYPELLVQYAAQVTPSKLICPHVEPREVMDSGIIKPPCPLLQIDSIDRGKYETIMKHNINLRKMVNELTDELINAGLRKPAITIDASRTA